MTKFIVDFKQDTSESQINEFLTQRGLTVRSVFDKLGLVYHVESSDPSLLAGSNDPAVSPLVEHFINDSDQELSLLGVFEVPQINYADVSVDPTLDENWWKIYSMTGTEWDTEAKTLPRKGANSTVYVMDSGIADSHADFVGANIVKLFSITGEYSDTTGHGTAIASVIAGRRCGVTDACIKVVKIFDQNIPLYQSSLLNAMNAIMTDYVNSNGKISVVNMSWTIPKNSYIESKIQTMIDMGLYVVCAAGNNGVPIENVTPASMKSVITIGAYNQDFEPCDFSNYQASSIAVTAGSTNHGEIDGWAPGQDILVADVATGGFSLASGTSMAAAIASSAYAYNLTALVDGNGIMYAPLVSTFSDKEIFVYMGVNDRPLLILDPNKYSEDSNRLVGFLAFLNKKIPAAITIKLVQGKQNAAPLFKGQKVKSISYDSAVFPQGLTLEHGGFLVGDPIIDLEGKKAKIIDSEVQVTFTDDTTVNTPIQIAVMASDFNVDEVEDSDPILAFTAANIYVCFGSYCGFYACGSWFCYDIGYKSVQCTCAGN
jgi:hypothetical protein